jgi:hypothetical protein
MLGKHVSYVRRSRRLSFIFAASVVALLAAAPLQAQQFPLAEGCAPAGNRPPVAAPDEAITYGTAAVKIAVLANDSDPDGNPLKVAAVTPPFSGSATINLDGTITYRPAGTFFGIVQFSYTVIDGLGGMAAGIVNVNVTSLVLALGFEEGAGLVAADSSGLGNKATLKNGAAWTFEGAYGGGVAFDGINDLLSVAAHPSLNGRNITVEAWVMPTDIDGWRTILLKQLSTSTSMGLTYALYANSAEDGGPGAYVRPSGMSSDQHVNAFDPLPEFEWHHVAMTYNGSVISLYVDGFLVAARKTQTALSTSSLPLFIGGNPLWGEFFKGTIDEVRVYNRALSEGEIVADMFTPVR